MKILHTADWHLGTFRSPVKDGVNLRTEDTKKCLGELIRVAREEKPEYSLISGDIFHVGRLWSDRCCEEIITAIHYIKELAEVSKQVVVMRGTPNHDGAGQFEVLREMFSDCQNVSVITEPQVLSFDDVDIAVLPGFDRGVYRAKFPGLSKEEENEVFTNELSNIVLGLKAQCNPEKKSILMTHYTVPGCNTESGQVMMLTQFEPIIPQEALLAADYDLVALGHIHRPQKLMDHDWYYSGAINAMNFNDEGQERGFWIHRWDPIGVWASWFHQTPIREFITFNFTDTDITAINIGNIDEVALNYWRYNGTVMGKIVRIHYSCSVDNSKALNKALLEKTLLEDGAFMVWEILPDKIDEFANRTELENITDPEVNLRKYLEEKQFPPEKIQELILKARPVMTEAEASMPTAANTGTFVPVEITVKNYRNYEEETFNFEDISFCTINGQNGAGKSSLFMDAIVDCLYEEPREGEKTGWIRNDEKARSGSIMFSFRIGEKTYRVTRTRARSGKGTLNIAQLVDGEWTDCSKEKYNDTQQEILNIVGMDSLTFKSCALIMQDQYGLFLQAKPEERVEVLGTLLGLGVYQSMEKIAFDKAKVFGAKMREMKQEVDIHSSTISGFGDPQAELELCEVELNASETRLKEKTAERDAKKLTLTHQQEAVERRNKLLAEVRTLQAKRASTEQSRAAQQSIIDTNSIILESKPEIEAKVAEHNSLVERERVLSKESALYSSKSTEAADYRKQEVSEQTSIDRMNIDLTQRQTELDSLQPTEQDEVVREKAAEYEQQKKKLSELYAIDVQYRNLLQQKQSVEYAIQMCDSKYLDIHRAIQREEEILKKKTEILENVECVDIENAICGFLADAISAKKQLTDIEKKYSDNRISEEAERTPLQNQFVEICEKIKAANFDENALSELTKTIEQLKPYAAKLEELNQRESKIALVKAKIENLQSNILEAQKRLATVKLKATEAEQECDRYAQSHEEYSQVQTAILLLKPWIEKEKQIPVAEERKTTATTRILELAVEVTNIDTEIAEKQAEAEKESLATNGVEELQAIVNGLETEVNGIASIVKNQQMKIGALKQKAEQIEKLKKEIEVLQEQQTEFVKETSDYDTLKAAFSQSGVPHQIIRSIIPQLTAASNSILGQMTGGKMGVEFRLERLQKNGKEKGSLDIFIEEYGKSVLPYLSKSGGEKVKSSLSVILSLAEIKSSSVGIQLGMLFIDEPPFLDGDGIQAYCDALETIQSRYDNIKIMAITHDPTMKARFPQNLDVVKTENGSKVIY